MKLSFTAVLLAFAVGALAQVDLQDPVKMDRRGNIIPAANKPRSQWEDYLKRRQFGDEGTPTKTDDEGNIEFVGKRAEIPNEMPIAKRAADPNAQPAVYMPRDGTNLQDPVKMDRFGRIIKA